MYGMQCESCTIIATTLKRQGGFYAQYVIAMSLQALIDQLNEASSRPTPGVTHAKDGYAMMGPTFQTRQSQARPVGLRRGTAMPTSKIMRQLKILGHRHDARQRIDCPDAFTHLRKMRIILALDLVEDQIIC